MPQSLAHLIVHVVFSTKGRVPFLKDADLRTRLHSYIGGTLKTIECEPILVNGTDDHVHVLTNLSRKAAISDLVENAKRHSSKWMKEQSPASHDFYWQSGYGAFSVSESNVEAVREYVANQEDHHRRLSFQDAFRALCKKHRIEFDERYVWE